jgi:hypothetical protein
VATPTTTFCEDQPPFGENRSLILYVPAMTQGTGVFHEVFVVDGPIPVPYRPMGVLLGGCHTLTAMTDSATEFFKIMSLKIGVGRER